jgi:lipocalin
MQPVKVDWLGKNRKNEPVFLGKWYERFRIDDVFERPWGFNVTATYEYHEEDNTPPKKHKIARVYNEETVLVGKHREIRGAHGTAEVLVEEGEGKLGVSFDPAHVFKGPYWVWGKNEDADYMIVAGPATDKKYCWVLARNPHSDMSKSMTEVEKLPHGFKRSQFRPIGHD